ncbi:MAG: DUF1015 domain-containing protein [Lewinellaceae bacterium]|nr:DUF1015 domain-containing protein [Saprospiraceae bacterium]MCB9338947.1 DUF1015 domain-containing protein [Lewinellaceae bacterium]
MHIQPFQAVYPDTGLISSADHFFSNVKEKFNDYWDSGFFKKLPQEGLYIHRIHSPKRIFTGMVACIDVQDYLDGHVKKHENTLAAAEQEQTQLLLRRSAQVKPVMLTYRKVQAIDDILNHYAAAHPSFLEVHFDEVDEQHQFWEIKEGLIIQQLQALFQEQVADTYIADGHHRTSSAAMLFKRFGKKKADNPFRWLPCAFYPTTELEIHDYNRIVEGLNDLKPTVFMAQLSRVFEIEVLKKPHKPARKHELTMYLDRAWFGLRWRKSVLDTYKNEPVILDVNLLNEQVLKGILGIRNVRTDARVKYLQGPKGLDILKERTLKNEERLAFCLHPVKMEDFLQISDLGGVLPPKSTWFEPRIRSGLLVRQFSVG